MISKRGKESETPAKVAVAWGAGWKPSIDRQGEEPRTATSGQTKSEDHSLMERVVERSNLWSAYERVVRNKGAAGVDDLAVTELKDWLKVHWLSVKQALLEGRYLPRPVRRVDIPKPQGGVRTLGVPTVKDRVVQTAVVLVIGPIFEADLLPQQYGFRPSLDAKTTVRRVYFHITQHDRRELVDADLSDYFTTIAHGPLLRCVTRRVADGQVLSVIKQWLTVPVWERAARGIGFTFACILLGKCGQFYGEYTVDLDVRWRRQRLFSTTLRFRNAPTTQLFPLGHGIDGGEILGCAPFNSFAIAMDRSLENQGAIGLSFVR